MPERSFFVGGYQFPLCARCTGILVGHIIGLILLPIHVFGLIWGLLMIPMVLDGGIQYLTSYRSNNIRRFLTGLLYGVSFISFIHSLFHFIKGMI